MKTDRPQEAPLAKRPSPGWGPVITSGLLLVVLVALLIPRQKARTSAGPNPADNASVADGRLQHNQRFYSPPRGSHSATNSDAGKTAEEMVAAKLARFGHSRQELAQALAKRAGVAMPEDVQKFFEAVESGNWEEIDARFKALSGGEPNAGHSVERRPEVSAMWAAIVDAYGAAEQVHLWPAQKLLDYGNSLLGSLRPGMIYVGGTDNGRWIPELLNDTSGGEQHMVLTQNGLADGQYLDYLNLLYGDRLAMLTQSDSQQAFQDYIADARKRFEHDQQFPDQPKQVLPGESISVGDNGSIKVSGQVAVMLINERLLNALMQKNPDQTFALQESFPLKGAYANALPLGPLMELGAADAQNAFTPQRATQAVDYWTSAANTILADPQATASESAMRSYSHDVDSTANLLAAHDFTGQAEQAYRLASQLWPGNPEPINGLAELLNRNGRGDEVTQLLNDFIAKYPDQRSTLQSRWSASITFKQ